MTLGKIAIVADSRLFRAGLASLLEHEAASPVVEMDDVEDLAGRYAAEPFDLLLLHMGSKEWCEPSPVWRARALLPHARIAVLADEFNPLHLRQCFSEGADGYILKHINGETLFASLQLVINGEKIMPVAGADMLLRTPGQARYTVPENHQSKDGAFSEREADILRCLAYGASNKQIALHLKIAEATVKVHLKSILKKTRAANRTQAAIWAVQRGLFETAVGSFILYFLCGDFA